MDIGPISAIRPVTLSQPSRSAPDLSRVMEAEYLGQSAEDEYTPNDRKAARGLEDEEDPVTTKGEDAAGTGTQLSPIPTGKVNLFA